MTVKTVKSLSGFGVTGRSRPDQTSARLYENAKSYPLAFSNVALSPSQLCAILNSGLQVK